MPKPAIVLFDGECPFCCGAAKFILHHDPAGRFRFAPLQNEVAEEVLEKHGFKPNQFDSLALVDRDQVYFKSTAALRIAAGLTGFWPMLSVFLLVPKPIRDFFYDQFSKRRHRWFGRQDSCYVPDEQERQRFLA